MDIFVATPLGFEATVAREIREVWPDLLDASARAHGDPLPEMNEVEGGIEMSVSLVAAAQPDTTPSTDPERGFFGNQLKVVNNRVIDRAL